MNIDPVSIKVSDIFDGYVDNGDDGVFAYGGKLAVRPAYQREFVYDQEQEESVIHTVLNGFPSKSVYSFFSLNVKLGALNSSTFLKVLLPLYLLASLFMLS